MTWVFERDAAPPAIGVQVGSDGFKLTHRYLDAERRLQAMDALAAGVASVAAGQLVEAENCTLGLTACWRVLSRHISGWEGVVDGQGNPVPFHRRDPDSGKKVSNLSEVLSQVSPNAQMRVMAIQLAMNGVRFTQGLAELFARVLFDNAEIERIQEDAERFFRWPEQKGGACSPPSVNGATDTTGSDSGCRK